MKPFQKHFLTACGVLAIVLIASLMMFAGKRGSVGVELDKMAKRNSAELVTYFRTEIDKDDADEAMAWLKARAETTKDYVVPLIYSQMLSAKAKESKKKLTKEAYLDVMTTASIMYIFADVTMTGDFLRCKDKTAQSGIAAIRAARFRPIYEFLTTEADLPTRERIMKEGFTREEKIATRPPNESACAHGIGTLGGEKKEYVPAKEWKELRAETIDAMKKSFAKRYLRP